MAYIEQSSRDWDSFPFHMETVLTAIPRGTRTSALHVSISPTPAHGTIIVMGRTADGGTRRITLSGTTHATELPFVDRVIRIQYQGDTSAVQVELHDYARA